MTNRFSGLLYAPSYEYEVIMLFGMVLTHLDDKFEIEEYNDEFPDCIARVNGEETGIEFEVKASAFKTHKHHLDPRLPNCSYIVCWENDTGKDSLRLALKETRETVEIKIITLSKIVENLEESSDLRFVLNPERPKHPFSKWNKETFLQQLRERVVDTTEYHLIEELLEFCEKHKELEVVYGAGKIASLSVRIKRWGRIAPFGAMANGVVYINFKDANKLWVYPQETEDELRKRFNQPPTSYYRNYRVKSAETLTKIREALEWLAETSAKF